MKPLPALGTALHPFLYAYFRYVPLQKGKQRLLRLVGRYLLPQQAVRHTRLKLADLQMRCDLHYFIQRQLYFLGEYEPEQVALWQQLAQQAKIIFDVGANVGLYALAAAAANHQATIHAFEPTPELVERLQENISLNDFANIMVNAAAVGQQAGEIVLHYSGGHEGDNEGMNYVSAQTTRSSDRVVSVVSLDAYCQQQGIEAIDLLKMDIEGHEYHALCGAERLLSHGAIRCILLELNSWAVERSGRTLADVVDLLSGHDYRFYELCQNRLVEIKDRRLLVDRDVVVIPTAASTSLTPFWG